jgi:hypothetical protein
MNLFIFFLSSKRRNPMTSWRLEPSGMQKIHRPDDGGTTHLWNIQHPPTRLHGTTFQKALIFIFAAVRTWNLIMMSSQAMMVARTISEILDYSSSLILLITWRRLQCIHSTWNLKSYKWWNHILLWKCSIKLKW